MTNQSLKNLSKLIEESSQLQKIQLNFGKGQNDVNEEGVTNLSMSLQKLSKLKQISIQFGS